MKPPIQPPQQFGMLRLPPARHPGPPHPLEPLVPPAEAIIWEHRFIISCIDCIIPCIEGMGIGVGVATARLLGPCDALATAAPGRGAVRLPWDAAAAHEAEPTKPVPAKKTNAAPSAALMRSRLGTSFLSSPEGLRSPTAWASMVAATTY